MDQNTPVPKTLNPVLSAFACGLVVGILLFCSGAYLGVPNTGYIVLAIIPCCVILLIGLVLSIALLGEGVIDHPFGRNAITSFATLFGVLAGFADLLAILG